MSSTAEVTIPEVVRHRKITGMSAVLLPFQSNHQVDWNAFEAHVQRTLDVGLIPAVNMDTGYINLLDEATRAEVLTRTQKLTDGQEFVAGAFLADEPGTKFNFDEYVRRMNDIETAGGTPVIFQSYGLTQQPDDEIVRAYQDLSRECDRFVGFELGTVFLPFGKIYSIDVYRELMALTNCIGAKHSSLEREPEWQRINLRNEVRPDFMVLTGNDLAVDMVMYGSDYLLGLSSFGPDLFARRDKMWESGDPGFYQLNDVLQYLGFFGFRSPIGAYKHTCAQFLKLRGMINSDLTHPDSLKRPDTDLPILEAILELLPDGPG